MRKSFTIPTLLRDPSGYRSGMSEHPQQPQPPEGPDDPAFTGELSEKDFSGGESSPTGTTPDEPTPDNKAQNDSARQADDQTKPVLGESIEDL